MNGYSRELGGITQSNVLLCSWGIQNLARGCDLSKVTLCLRTIESINFSLPGSLSLLPDLSRPKAFGSP